MFLRLLTGFRIFSRKHGRNSKGALERSSNTSLREMSSKRSGKLHVIETLDSNKFVEKKQKCLHIGDRQTFIPHISLLNQSSPVRPPRLRYDPAEAIVTQRFPPDTKAFLYYFMSPETPRIAGELRLRVVSRDDPSCFESGSDLLRRDGQRWSRPLYSLSKYYPSLYGKLREERLVPDDLDTALSTLPSKMMRYTRSHLLYTLNDTFIVDFSNYWLDPIVITEQGVEKVEFHNQFFDSRKTSRATPYTGSALARFERSTLPNHEGTRTIVLRFLKIITPVKCVIPDYDGYICFPKEGELLQRSEHSLEVAVWNINIDRPNYRRIRGLKLLWDI